MVSIKTLSHGTWVIVDAGRGLLVGVRGGLRVNVGHGRRVVLEMLLRL